METKIIITRLRKKFFPDADDQIWKQWVNYKKRQEKDLIELLTSDVRDSLKRRAIFLLLVPSVEFNPIFWTEEVGKFCHRSDFLKKLNPNLLDYAADLIIEFCTKLKPLHCDKPKYYSEGGGGITIFTSVPDRYHSALCFYNNCSLLLLTMLSEEKCERIFSVFSIRDISTYEDMEDSSGYNPFSNLMYSNNVNEKWKRLADDNMRQIIIDEVAGKTAPREEWENALKCYAHTIQLLLCGEDLPYSVELFANQIKFLVSKDYYGEQLINNWDVAKIFTILSGDEYKEIRYLVAKYMILGNKEEFRIWSEETLQGALMILDEFNQNDEKLTQHIQLAIKNYKKKAIEAEKEKVSTKETEAKIMSQMK